MGSPASTKTRAGPFPSGLLLIMTKAGGAATLFMSGLYGGKWCLHTTRAGVQSGETEEEEKELELPLWVVKV